jgi:HAD superfamily hydrolase (TIGR01509 family)
MPVRGLFFDFDGLICDTERAARRSWEELYGEVGLVFPPEVWARMHGRPDGETVAAADLARRLHRPVDRALLARRLDRKGVLSRREPLRPGLAELTAAALRHGLTLAVVSSSSSAWVRSHLTRLGVLDRFAAVVTGESARWHKPAPDLYRLALVRTGLRPGEVVAFEDSPAGVRSARAAGLRCVAVPSSVGGHADLSVADTVLDSLAGYPVETAGGPGAGARPARSKRTVRG